MSVTFINPFILGGVSPAGQQVFTSSGTFVVPADVTSISPVAVGRGQANANPAGRGGDLRYAIALAVTPLESLDVEITASGTTIKRGGTTLLAARSGAGGLSSSTIGGNIGGGNGGSGGSDGASGEGGGGGAGGYSGNGGTGGAGNGSSGTNGSGGAGGGGGGGGINGGAGGFGGGVGLLGAGSSGAGGAGGNPTGTTSGTAGSPGSGGSNFSYGGGLATSSGTGVGGVRIIWGAGRAYPSTNVADV